MLFNIMRSSSLEMALILLGTLSYSPRVCTVAEVWTAPLFDVSCVGDPSATSAINRVTCSAKIFEHIVHFSGYPVVRECMLKPA
jgi:hypothetical protein